MFKSMRKHTKTIMAVVIAFFVLSCFAGYGFYARSGRDGGGERDYAAAKINGRRVMRSTLERTTVQIAERSGMNDISAADWLTLRQMALDNLAIEAELEKEVKSRKIDVTKEEVESEYTNTMDSFPTREAFKEFLERSGLTEQTVKNDIKNELKRRKIITALISEITITDEEAREFYDAIKTLRYSRPDGFMINIASFSTAETAEKVRRALERGAEWDAVLEENKDEILVSNAYDKPGEISEGEIDGNQALAPLKRLRLDRVSPVIQLADSEFAVVIKREKTNERILDFEEVSGDVNELVKSQRSEKVFIDLRARAKVEILDPSIFPGAELPQESQPEASGEADLPGGDASGEGQPDVSEDAE